LTYPTISISLLFFFNDPATTDIYTLSLHDALPISRRDRWDARRDARARAAAAGPRAQAAAGWRGGEGTRQLRSLERSVTSRVDRRQAVSGSQSKSGQWSSTGHFSLSTACGLASRGLELYFKPVIERIGRRTVAAVKIVGRFGHFMGDLARAVPDVDVWGRLTLVQLRRVGVDSLPVALFIAAFTGVVLALQASYTFRNTVPLYFVGTLVGKT